MDIIDSLVNGVVSCFCPGLCVPSRSPEDGATADPTKQQGEGEQVHPDLPLEYMLKRFVINTAALWTWLPYIILISCRENHFGESLIFGTSFSGFCVLFNCAMWVFRQKRGLPYILDGAFTMFFAVYCGVYFGASQHQAELEKWMMVVVHAWLSFVMLASIAARFPFTLQYAREAAPEEAWHSRVLLSVCGQLAGMWGASFGISCLLCLAPIMTDQNSGSAGLNVVFNYLWPVLSLLGLLLSARWWPAFIRRLYYIPRMLNNTVTPDSPSKPAGPGTPGPKDAEHGGTPRGTVQHGSVQGGAQAQAAVGAAGRGSRQLSSPAPATLPPGPQQPPSRGTMQGGQGQQLRQQQPQQQPQQQQQQQQQQLQQQLPGPGAMQSRPAAGGMRPAAYPAVPV